jgi:hypothetical protein
VTTALLIFAVFVAILACPLHGVWRMRRGRSGCGRSRAGAAATLRARQLALGERVRELRSAADRAGRD